MPAPEQSPAITEAKLKAPPRYISVKSTEAAQFRNKPYKRGYKRLEEGVSEKYFGKSVGAQKLNGEIQRKRENKQKAENLQRMCESRYKNSLVLVAVAVLPLHMSPMSCFSFSGCFFTNRSTM